MDTDLFQGVLLGLLAVGLIVLIALLATLGGIRRALEQRSAQRAAAPQDSAPAALEAASEPQTQAAEPITAEAQTGYTGAGSYATPAASTGAAAASGGRADSIRSVLQEHGVGGAEEQAAAAPEAQEPVVDSAFAAHADDPQAEPFQRDGRWWFRRGDELLLYDESSGQWQPAPEGAAPTGTGTAPAAAAGQTAAASVATAEAGSTTSTQTMPAVADQVATFWKCPTCGAVNGSTAATCRMCFAARP